jgi:hypothetical protein
MPCRSAVLLAALLCAGSACADPPHARAKASAPAVSAGAAVDEPLEQLAMRLAERLGARQSPHGDSLVMRVPARAGAAVAPAAPARRPAPRRNDCD